MRKNQLVPEQLIRISLITSEYVHSELSACVINGASDMTIHQQVNDEHSLHFKLDIRMHVNADHDIIFKNRRRERSHYVYYISFSIVHSFINYWLCHGFGLSVLFVVLFPGLL